MPVQVNVPGLATIKIAPGQASGIGGTLATLGYTQNGAQITFEGYELRVPGDENGGDDGPPVEIQYLGQTARIRLEMTKFDVTVSDTILKRLPSGTLGMPETTDTPVGTLLFANTQFFRLVIATPTTLTDTTQIRPFNFPCCNLVRSPQELNVGTKFQRHILEVECYKHPTSKVLWDRTVT